MSPETCRADSNRSIKRSIKENVCIFLVAYTIVLRTYSLTNVNFLLKKIILNKSENNNEYFTCKRVTAVAQWLRCCATNHKVAGSIPAGVSGFFH